MRFAGHPRVTDLRSRAAVAALNAGGVESTLAIWPEQGNLARADARRFVRAVCVCDQAPRAAVYVSDHRS